MNNISIVGRLTKDVELSTTASGIEFARFNVAVASEFKSADGEKQADFFICIAWRETAKNISKYFKKGYPIGLVGSMNSRSYEKEDGSKQLVWELNVKNFSFVGSSNDESEKPETNKGSKKSKKETQMQITPVDEDDDNLPF